jgi:hypothetical protein
MATCEHSQAYRSLALPNEYEDLDGLIHADLRAVVSMLTERANERLFLTHREITQLQTRLWNDLTRVVNDAMEPLTAENR